MAYIFPAVNISIYSLFLLVSCANCSFGNLR